jgi:hypothetical protein
MLSINYPRGHVHDGIDDAAWEKGNSTILYIGTTRIYDTINDCVLVWLMVYPYRLSPVSLIPVYGMTAIFDVLHTHAKIDTTNDWLQSMD